MQSDSVLTRVRAFVARLGYIVLGGLIVFLVLDRVRLENAAHRAQVELEEEKVKSNKMTTRSLELLDRVTATSSICLVALQDLREKVNPSLNQAKNPDPEPSLPPRQTRVAKFE